MTKIDEIWHSNDRKVWRNGLARYWDQVSARNRRLEEDLDRLDLNRVRAMNAESWHAFLRDEYFRWKYTAPNRYASTTRLLRLHVEAEGRAGLDAIRKKLLSADVEDIEGTLATAQRVPGLGAPGASGLLALLFPSSFGTVDQFVVRGLLGVSSLPEHSKLAKMKPESLRPSDGAVLIRIMRKKAAENIEALHEAWTPRMVDMVLWGYREPG